MVPMATKGALTALALIFVAVFAVALVDRDVATTSHRCFVYFDGNTWQACDEYASFQAATPDAARPRTSARVTLNERLTSIGWSRRGKYGNGKPPIPAWTRSERDLSPFVPDAGILTGLDAEQAKLAALEFLRSKDDAMASAVARGELRVEAWHPRGISLIATSAAMFIAPVAIIGWLIRRKSRAKRVQANTAT